MKAFDMHCDTLLGGNRNHWDLVNDQMHISLDKLGAFEHYVQCFAIFIPDQFRGQDAIDFYDRTFAYYKAQTEKYADRMEWAHNGKELAQAKKPITGILTIEGRLRAGRRYQPSEAVERAGCCHDDVNLERTQ